MAQILTEAEPTTSDDGERSPDTRERRPKWLRWLLLLLPWTWFVVRGLHPWFELVAILLPVLTISAAAAALLVATYRRDALFLAMIASLMLFYVVAIVLPGRPIESPRPAETTRFAAINVASRWFSDNDVGFFIYEREPDIFVGIELREPQDEDLRSRYEFAISDLAGFAPNPPTGVTIEDLASTYRENDAPSIGIYSRHPMVPLPDPIVDQVAGGLPGFRVQIATEQGDVIVYALHVPRPGSGGGPYEVSVSEQRELLDAISSSIAAEELPVVVIGDLNIADRGPAFARFSEAFTDVMRIDRWAGPTRHGDLWHTALRLRIDHLLVGDGLCATAAQAPDVFFTDHSPIQADIGPCPAT